MDCEIYQTALSARADAEPVGIPDTVIAWHLRGCADCRAFAAALEGVPPAVEAARGVDISDRVLAEVGRIDRAEVWTTFRMALFAVAAGELLLALPDLLGRAPQGDVHLARHLGAFQVAYAIGLIVVAVRPAKARAMVPQTLALAAAMIGAAIADIGSGVAPAIAETQHLLEIAGLLLVWFLATRRGWPRRTRALQSPRPAADASTSRPTGPTLVAVDVDRDNPADRLVG